MRAGALAGLLLALGCSGTRGGVLPDAHQADAFADPCADPDGWASRELRPIAPVDQPPGAIAVDDAYAYWTGPGVLRAPLSGDGEAELLFADPDGQEPQPGALAATRDHLFVVLGGELWRMGKDGSAPEAVGAADELVADADAVYFRANGELVRMAEDTLEQTAVGAAPMEGAELELAAGALWWLTAEPVDIWRVTLPAGEPEPVGQIDGTGGGNLAVNATGRVFLATWPLGDPSGPASLVGLAPGDGAPQAIAELAGSVAALVADDSHVYWLEPDGARLSRVPVDGGCLEVREQDGLAGTVMAPAVEGIVVAGAGTIALVER